MEPIADHRRSKLPDPLHEHMVWPVRFEFHRDDSVPASKFRGYDASRLLFRYRQRFS